MSVVLATTGAIEPNGEALPNDEAVTERARGMLAKDRAIRAVIKADGAVPHSRVMHVLGELRGAGVSKIAFGVVPLPAASGAAAAAAAKGAVAR